MQGTQRPQNYLYFPLHFLREPVFALQNCRTHMVIVSCPGKFHAFSLAEQLYKHDLLELFYTGYAYQKNTIFRNFAGRVDKENIPKERIRTFLPWAIQARLGLRESFKLNENFDSWVAWQIKKKSRDYKAFIGWASISLNSIRQAKRDGKITILERGSTHILHQNDILHEEYKAFGKDFSINPAVIEMELKEYEEADYISIPSFFVKRSFIGHGINERKLIMNPYGAGKFFTEPVPPQKSKKDKFILVYLGTLSIRKGLLYLFRALHQLTIPKKDFEVWFIGSVTDEIKPAVEQYRNENWKFWGQINHYDLHRYLSQCDVGIQPSVEEGLSMVIPQLMACGVPVIVTPNTGGENIITESVNGFIVPMRRPDAIAEKIEFLYNNSKKMEEMKKAAATSISNGFTWNDYGSRYINFINLLI